VVKLREKPREQLLHTDPIFRYLKARRCATHYCAFLGIKKKVLKQTKRPIELECR
jgi:hypothetical protein